MAMVPWFVDCIIDRILCVTLNGIIDILSELIFSLVNNYIYTITVNIMKNQ